jgi:hypothetical protein
VKTLPWSRQDSIARLRSDVWRYVTQAADTEEDILLIAAALLQMPASEVRFLAQLQFILSEPVGRLLEQMPLLIRRLTTTSINELEVSAEHIRGAVRWGETFAWRAATGTPHAFVTAPTRRAFQTPENEVLAFALHAIADFGKRTGWHTSRIPGPAGLVRERVADGTRWLQSRALADVVREPPSAKTISRVRASRNRRRYQAALDVVDLYRRYIARLDRMAIREAVEQHALVVSSDSVLFELQSAFQIMKVLRKLGWHAPPGGLLRPPLLFSAQRDDRTLELFYQHAPAPLTKGSRYRNVQQAHHFPAVGGLIPDLVIRIDTPTAPRWILVEVKVGYTRRVEDSARAAARDLLGYRRAFGSVLALQDGPYGIGYAWGARN